LQRDSTEKLEDVRGEVPMGFVSGALQIRFRGGLRIGYLGKLGKLAPRRIFSPPEDTVQKCRCLLFFPLASLVLPAVGMCARA